MTPATPPVYDSIGAGYRDVRRPDPRLHTLIATALKGARTVVNVGAGAGSYEPQHAAVTAVDPSRVMLDQHPGRRGGPVFQGRGELRDQPPPGPGSGHRPKGSLRSDPDHRPMDGCGGTSCEALGERSSPRP